MAQVNLGHVVGPGVPTGGTANQVLVKNGATNFDTSWKDASLLPAISDEATAREAADAALADGLAIIANGDTHAAVAADQAVFVRSHSTLAPGLYWASSAIGTNAALSTSNLTADNKGGLNKLKGDIDSLNSKFANYALKSGFTPSIDSISTGPWTTHHFATIASVTKSGSIVTANLRMVFTDDYKLPTGTNFALIPDGFRPSSNIDVPALIQVNNADAWIPYIVTIQSNGYIRQGFSSSCTGVAIMGASYTV